MENVPSWRTLAVHAWGKPNDPSVYGLIDVHAKPAADFVAGLREKTGEKITLTHLIAKAVAVAIAERPDVNAIIRRGRLYQRDTVDIFFQVAFEGGENLAGCKVSDVGGKSVLDIATELRQRADRIRRRKDDPTQKSTNALGRLPPWLTGLAMRLGETLTFDYDLDLTKIGVPYDAFGSCMITNVAGFGLTVGYAPLFPPSRTPIILTVGAVRDAPAAVDGEVTVQPTMTIGASFDHRVLDGFQAGRLAKRFKEVLEHPEQELD